jgi:hypothetical protein
MLETKLTVSAIEAVLVFILISILFLLFLYLPTQKLFIITCMLVITFFWLLRLIFFKHYQFKICSKQNSLTLCYNNAVEIVTYKKFYEITFLLTILYLKTPNHIKIIPIFIDSMPIKHYKQIRVYLRWH